MDNSLIYKAKIFLTERFNANPSYSFGDSSIMIEHSIHVFEIAENLVFHYDGDLLLVQIGALFHDIGKTMMVDGKPVNPEILREKHEQLNIEIAMDFFINNSVEDSFIINFSKLFDHEADLIEKFILKEADIIEFYMNFKLQTALNNWALEHNISGELQRKADKFHKVLKLDWSKEFARPYYETMIKRWGLQIR